MLLLLVLRSKTLGSTVVLTTKTPQVPPARLSATLVHRLLVFIAVHAIICAAANVDGLDSMIRLASLKPKPYGAVNSLAAHVAGSAVGLGE